MSYPQGNPQPMPEAQARVTIDAMLAAAGWVIQDYRAMNLGAAAGIALREVPLNSGRCDYNPKNRHNRKETERFKCFGYEELVKRDKANLDLFWLKDEALEDSANLPAPGIIAQEIVADLEAALEQFAAIEEDLKE